jgi:hypothetical protein
MALRAAALAFALGIFASMEAWAERVGSWRNQPRTNAIVYDSRGRRLFWDDNGQLVGRYNFRSNRYESIDARPAGVGNSLAAATPPAKSPFVLAGKPVGATPRNVASARFPAPVYVGGQRRRGSR